MTAWLITARACTSGSSFWTWNQETGFTTTVERTGDLSSRVQAAIAGRLYVACGLGPPLTFRKRLDPAMH